jgi:hypothetical protein
MSSAQIVFVLFLAAAFAAGWFASERPRGKSDRAWARKLEGLLSDCTLGLADEDARPDSLEPLRRKLEERLGPRNPLTVEFGQACDARCWLAEHGDGAPSRAAVEQAARDAQMRFGRLARAVSSTIADVTDRGSDPERSSSPAADS